MHERRFVVTVAAVVATLAAVNVVVKFGPAHTGLILGPAVAIGLVVLARRSGLSWDDVGLARHSWAKGALCALAAIMVVAAIYLAGAAIPASRAAFLDARYRLPVSSALFTALVVIPIGTVLLEEVAFRGVLLGLIRRHRGTAWATSASSTLFGLWHVLPSLRLGDNAAAGAAFGAGGSGRVMLVLAAVGFTAVAGWLLCELRRRSGSLLAAAGLHWATNGLGVLLAAMLWAHYVA